MGAAIGILNAMDIVRNGYNKPTKRTAKACLVTSIVFACPVLGDSGFSTVLSTLKNLHILRVTNEKDLVPLIPGGKYVHVGKELRFDSLKSPYLKALSEFKDWDRIREMLHDLEVYLHGVAGTQGVYDFKMEVNRDISLVNKLLDAVKDEHRIVVRWWTQRNKSMVQKDGGSWVLMDHEKDDE